MSAEVIDNLISQAVQHTNSSDCIALAADMQAASDPGELNNLRRRIDEAERDYNVASRTHTSALAFGIPFLVVTCAFLAALWDTLLRYAHLPVLSFWSGTATLWAFALAIATPIYYFRYRRRYILAKESLANERQSLIAVRLSTGEGRKQYYRQELFRLSSKAARVFYGDEKRFSLASQWAERAGNILDGSDKTVNLSVVQSCLNSLNELVAREEREQAEEVRWQKWAIAVMFLFVALLVGAALLTNKDPGLLEQKVFGVPLSVILWGAAGSLAAILYRFYTEQGQIRFAAEFRWLIARPIIGIIMGAVVYLALLSGLIIVSPNGPADEGAPRMQALWIISFLAGFSDKFYLGVIDLLVARTVRTQEIDSNTVVTEIERIPDSSPEDGPDSTKSELGPSVG